LAALIGDGARSRARVVVDADLHWHCAFCCTGNHRSGAAQRDGHGWVLTEGRRVLTVPVGGWLLIRIDRMARIERIAISADSGVVTAMFEAFLGCVVVRLAKRLQIAKEKRAIVFAVRLDVMRDGGERSAPFLTAHAAERFDGELVPTTDAPVS